MPRDDEQGVVDADRQAQHEAEHGCGRADLHEPRGPERDGHRQSHAEERVGQRHDAEQQRPQDDDEHDQRDDHADPLDDGDLRDRHREHLAAD